MSNGTPLPGGALVKDCIVISPDTAAALERFRRQLAAEIESELGVRGLPLTGDDLVRCALARAMTREIAES
ncbi:MAG: hypothetical protein F4Y34_08345 [Gammaproteobacteria bacterium]|nr:hypothetical protein [Gammaproteobacteria bacterium]